MKFEPGHYYIPDTPRERGYWLLIEVTKDFQVQVVSPASKWWRNKVFATVEEFHEVFMKEYIFREQFRINGPTNQKG